MRGSILHKFRLGPVCPELYLGFKLRYVSACLTKSNFLSLSTMQGSNEIADMALHGAGLINHDTIMWDFTNYVGMILFRARSSDVNYLFSPHFSYGLVHLQPQTLRHQPPTQASSLLIDL